MNPREIFDELENRIDDLSRQECLGLIGRLEGVKTQLLSRFLAPVACEHLEEKSLLTVEEVAQELRMKASWVREKARRGELDGFKTGKSWRFHRQAVDRFQATLEGKPLTSQRENRARKPRGNVGIFQSKSRGRTHG